MDLWIRSTARTNLIKVRFLTILEGKKFYKKEEWEYKGYTLCNCTEVGYYEILGTYKTKERALEVLDEIQELIEPNYIRTFEYKGYEAQPETIVYEMPEE